MSVWYAVAERGLRERFEVAGVELSDGLDAAAEKCARAEYDRNGWFPWGATMTFRIYASPKGREKGRYTIKIDAEIAPKITATKI